jgi:hypothetical protein
VPLLAIAASREYAESCKALIGSGADVNARGKGGKSVLRDVSVESNPEICKLLIMSGADINSVIESFDDLSYEWHSMKGNGVWVNHAKQAQKLLWAALGLAMILAGVDDLGSLRHRPDKADKEYSLFMEAFNSCISGK